MNLIKAAFIRDQCGLVPFRSDPIWHSSHGLCWVNKGAVPFWKSKVVGAILISGAILIICI